MCNKELYIGDILLKSVLGVKVFTKQNHRNTNNNVAENGNAYYCTGCKPKSWFWWESELSVKSLIIFLIVTISTNFTIHYQYLSTIFFDWMEVVTGLGRDVEN